MTSKANQRVGMIKRSFSRLTNKSFLILYKSLVRPILEYCSQIWNPLYKKDIIEIEKVQRRATKLVPALRELPYDERLKKLKLTTLAYRRKRTDVIQVYRIITKVDKINFKDFFEYNQNPTRGHKRKLQKPRGDSNPLANSFSRRVIDDWNKLSKETVFSETINAFKGALLREWKNDPIKYSIENI